MQVFVLHKSPYIGVVIKRGNQIILKDTIKTTTVYTPEIRAEDCDKHPRYAVYMRGLQKAIEMLKQVDRLDDSITIIMNCRNVINWFDKGAAVEPYVESFTAICNALDDIGGEIRFMHSDTRLLEQRYCNEGSVKKEKLTNAVSFLQDVID